MPINWRPDDRPYFTTEVANVDVNALKLVMRWSEDGEDPPNESFDMCEVVRFDQSASALHFRRGGVRFIEQARLEFADPSIPVICGFLPYDPRKPDGSIPWGHDLVDGFHRLAVATMRGIKFLPMVRPSAHISGAFTQPKPPYTGPMFKDPAVRAPDGYWDLMENFKGSLFGLRGNALREQIVDLMREYKKIGIY